uniref:Candidate secreted effector n=1 Tax=Meloidogyne incognita TaxID=6306 RepID=A0A914LKA7_MELIC
MASTFVTLLHLIGSNKSSSLPLLPYIGCLSLPKIGSIICAPLVLGPSRLQVSFLTIPLVEGCCCCCCWGTTSSTKLATTLPLADNSWPNLSRLQDPLRRTFKYS